MLFAPERPVYILEYAANVVHCSCLNLMHGSKLSPPRRQQVNETIDEYFAIATCSDSWFQWHCNDIRAQMLPDLSPTEINCDQVALSVFVCARVCVCVCPGST